MAREKLISAAKLAPRLPGPWNCLGHCHWTAKELGLAQQCFERGLEASLNKEGLRQRSILRRHVASVGVRGLSRPRQPLAVAKWAASREEKGWDRIWERGRSRLRPGSE